MNCSLPCLLSALVVILVAFDFVQGEMKPTKFAKEVVCEGCHAVIAETNKIFGKGKRTDKTVMNSLRGICNAQRLNQYEFSPPTMKKVCDYWTENYETEIKAALTNGLPEDEQEIELCWISTDICKGVDRSHFRINKYEGPSKRKILAATKASTGEAVDEVTDEPPAEKKEDVKEEKKDKKTSGKKSSKSKTKKDGKGKDEL
ncbi:uncharacterized protein LOC115923535 [Strongylocentrotus purpuratus]|uniref:Saposin B-type domain-containing protein n=1 Tax=Strongylocentrotus purpuratus TaxID=7668 RepID=A0A7M7NR59_STRPU|nr:uncharacterized protein LOC115923535 [Strongylocentrotus purpuratus]